MDVKNRLHRLRRDAHAVYLAARDPRTPRHIKLLAAFVAGYAFSPIDLIPDFIPVLGWLDDLILVPLGVLLIIKCIPPAQMQEHRDAAAKRMEEPVSRRAAIVILLLWLLALSVCLLAFAPLLR